jgi:hypothetical protein
VHLPDGTQDTLLRVCRREPRGLAVGCSTHEVPNQFAAVVRLRVDHTAVHVLAEVQDTPAKRRGTTVVGPGVSWMDQEVPFHLSASVPAPVAPTAVQALAEVHDTPASGLRWLTGQLS